MRRAFPGYGKAFLPSLVLAVSKVTHDEESCTDSSAGIKSSFKVETDGDEWGGDTWDKTEKEEDLEEILYSSCKEWLLRVVTPEVMCKVARRSWSQHDCGAKVQHGESLRETELNRASGKGSLMNRYVVAQQKVIP